MRVKIEDRKSGGGSRSWGTEVLKEFTVVIKPGLRTIKLKGRLFVSGSTGRIEEEHSNSCLSSLVSTPVWSARIYSCKILSCLVKLDSGLFPDQKLKWFCWIILNVREMQFFQQPDPLPCSGMCVYVSCWAPRLHSDVITPQGESDNGLHSTHTHTRSYICSDK